MSSENYETVLQALKIIRDNYCHWSPQYILSDQSSIEAKSIKKVFPGINSGEQECKVILCVVYIMRLWISKIYDKNPVTLWLLQCTKEQKSVVRNSFKKQ
jgi:hypothetical protein